jgi:metallo-beta-lactamase family protein
MIQLSFHGAAETVTGSKYLLEAEGARVLIDCGMFQGLKALRLRNWDRLPFDPGSVDAVVLTHAHIDHVGYLPRFVRDGFRGPTYCTPATAELAELILLDAAKIQEEDAEYANRKGFSKHHPAQPLFDARDAERALKSLKTRPMGAWIPVAGPIRTRFHDSGHLLGSGMIEVEIDRTGDQPLRVLFSGDVGRYNAPLYFDPAPPPACDYLICESTYGDREHNHEPLLDQLERVVKEAAARGGALVMAAFAVGRSQQLIYLLRVLMEQRRIPELPIYLDSPMAVDATAIYSAHRSEHDLSEGQLQGEKCVLNGRNVHLARSPAESKRINGLGGPTVIIASSGMMTGGRILHHLRQRLPDPRSTIMLGGFMAEGSRGRLIEEGKPFVRIHGGDVPVRAAIARVSGLSGHADRSELLRWLAPLPPPKRTFLTHGEKPSAESLAAELRKTRQWDVVVPKMGETFTLE